MASLSQEFFDGGRGDGGRWTGDGGRETVDGETGRRGDGETGPESGVQFTHAFGGGTGAGGL